MDEISLLDSMLSLMFLLWVSWITFIASKKINFPYTVLLVIVWIILAFVESMGYIGFTRNFNLTPDMLFYIFLPILIFESAYNFNYKDLFKSTYSIFSLSILWVIISALSISWILYFVLPFFGFNIPYIICLLYWSLISATDTAAVLSLFKSIWAPKRLTKIFEWESLFNDWTSLAMFSVILWVLVSWSKVDFSTISSWIISFLSMFLWWFLFWWLTGLIFSKVIHKIKNNESVEITLTMILAHLTFILSELISEYAYIWDFNFQISWVISTTVAALIMWNYWRYKISPKVWEYMEKFWWFFAFIANSLVFILLWFIVSDIKVDFFSGAIFIVLAWIIAWIVSRAISVYLPLWIINKLKLERNIPMKWQHILAWWSPRWALALMMLLMVPSDLEITSWSLSFPIRDFLILITISTIMFTLFVKVPTVWVLIKKLKLNKLNSLERLEKEIAAIMIFNKNLEVLKNSIFRNSIDKKHYKKTKDTFEKEIKNSMERIKIISSENPYIIERILWLFSLWIQKIFLIELLTYNEIDERNFKYLLNRIEDKQTKLEMWLANFINLEDDYEDNFLENMNNIFTFQKDTDFFVRNRAKTLIIMKTIKELKLLKEFDFWFDKKYLADVIKVYEDFFELLPRPNIKNEKVVKLENKLFEKWILKHSENKLSEIKTKWILTTKLYDVLSERLDDVIHR